MLLLFYCAGDRENLLVAGYWILDTGYWMLVAGWWMVGACVILGA
jgi:hypothetical protein